MGGFVGMSLAVRYPDLIRSLTLLGTSADPESKENVERYKRLNFIVHWFGLRKIANQIMLIKFGHKFLQDQQRSELRDAWREILIYNYCIGITRAVSDVISIAKESGNSLI
mgnify:FL=1